MSETGCSMRLPVWSVLLVVVMAACWGGYSAWTERAESTIHVDVDGWGHLVTRQQNTGPSLAQLFHDPTIWKGPLVPFVFGLCYALVPLDVSVLVLNVALFAISAGLLYRGFCAMGAPWPAALAAVLAWVFYPPHAIVFGYYFAEPLLTILSAGLFLGASRLVDSPRPWLALLAGGLGGLLLLARAPFLLVVVGLPVWYWFHGTRGRGRVVALYAAGLLAFYLPWPIRNYLTFGEIIPFTTESGKIVFHGTYLPGDDVGMDPMRQDNPEFAALEAAQPSDPIEQYHYWRNLAMDQIWADPLGQARLCVRKFLRFWMYLPAHGWVPAWKTGVAAAIFLPLAFVGVWTGYRRRLVQLCALWVGGLWFFHALVHSEMRYNFPVMPLMFLLAALGLTQVISWPKWKFARDADASSQSVLAEGVLTSKLP